MAKLSSTLFLAAFFLFLVGMTSSTNLKALSTQAPSCTITRYFSYCPGKTNFKLCCKNDEECKTDDSGRSSCQLKSRRAI